MFGIVFEKKKKKNASFFYFHLITLSQSVKCIKEVFSCSVTVNILGALQLYLHTKCINKQ